MPMAPMSRSGRKPIRVFLPRLPQKRDTGNRLEIGVDTPLSNSSNGAGAPAAAFGKTAFADFASAEKRYADYQRHHTISDPGGDGGRLPSASLTECIWAIRKFWRWSSDRGKGGEGRQFSPLTRLLRFSSAAAAKRYASFRHARRSGGFLPEWVWII